MHQPDLADPASTPCLRPGRAWPRAQRALVPCHSSRGRVAHAARLRLPSVRLQPRVPVCRTPVAPCCAPSALAPHTSVACACCVPVPRASAFAERPAPPARAPAAPSVPSYLARAVSRHRPTPGSQYILYCNTNLLPTKLYCNTVSWPTQPPLLQYIPVHCNPNSTLQASFSAIQYSVLQYNFPLFSSPLLCNTMTVLQYNFLYFKPSLQYNPTAFSHISCNTISILQYKSFSQYNLGSSPKMVLHYFFFSFSIILK